MQDLLASLVQNQNLIASASAAAPAIPPPSAPTTHGYSPVPPTIGSPAYGQPPASSVPPAVAGMMGQPAASATPPYSPNAPPPASTAPPSTGATPAQVQALLAMLVRCGFRALGSLRGADILTLAGSAEAGAVAWSGVLMLVRLLVRSSFATSTNLCPSHLPPASAST